MTKKNKEKERNSTIKNKIIEVLLYLVSYTITFLIVEQFFDSFRISSEHRIFYACIAVLIIYVLNKVVRPLLVTITMPITGITFGLFYFVINSLILKITDWLMRSKLDFTNIWVLFLISILLSVIRFIIEEIIMKPVVKKAMKYE